MKDRYALVDTAPKAPKDYNIRGTGTVWKVVLGDVCNTLCEIGGLLGGVKNNVS
jgi:hypothetical protein